MCVGSFSGHRVLPGWHQQAAWPGDGTVWATSVGQHTGRLAEAAVSVTQQSRARQCRSACTCWWLWYEQFSVSTAGTSGRTPLQLWNRVSPDGVCRHSCDADPEQQYNQVQLQCVVQVCMAGTCYSLPRRMHLLHDMVWLVTQGCRLHSLAGSSIAPGSSSAMLCRRVWGGCASHHHPPDDCLRKAGLLVDLPWDGCRWGSVAGLPLYPLVCCTYSTAVL